MVKSCVVYLTIVLLVVAISSVLVTGQKPYSSSNQICCQGEIHTRGNNSFCCGSQKYERDTEQCCYPELTVIPLTGGQNDSRLTCCAGKGVTVGYNELCCDGLVSEQPQVLTQYDRFGCCGQQICCNNTIFNDASNLLGCCNGITYETNKAVCCNDTTVVEVPSTVPRYDFACCGVKGYDSKSYVCSNDDYEIYPKPQNVTCQDQYDKLCGDRVIGAQQMCCNDELFNPPYVWIDTAKGNGFFALGAKCCPGGVGIIQSASKEACCADGVRPIDNANQGCCGNHIYDRTISNCCDGKILTGSVNLNCCGQQLYDDSTQLCCGDEVYNRSEGYDSCCAKIYSDDY